MNRARLEMTAALLERLAVKPNPELGFDLGSWHCGTSACAVGHAMLDTAHQLEGLHADAYMAPEYGSRRGFRAVCEFYGLNNDTANFLFCVDEYPDDERCSPAAVAARIRILLAEESA